MTLRKKIAISFALVNFLGLFIIVIGIVQLQADSSLSGYAGKQGLMIGLAAVFTIVSSSVSILLGRNISRPVAQVARSAKQIAGGDLTVEEIKVKNRDEIGELAAAFNEMTANLRTLIQQAGAGSEQVASSSAQLTASTEQTSEAANQVSSAIQAIAIGAEMQEQGAKESAAAIQEMTIGIQQVAKGAASVSELAAETGREANSGNESLHKVIRQMDTIRVTVADSAAVVKRLGEQSEAIEEIISAITTIAEQTNLLALNAAIESARAGEHGRGFAVVADEVRKLAEQSRNSADDIAARILKVQSDTQIAVEAMDKGTNEVQIGIEVVRETEAGFRKILQLIENVAARTQESTAVLEEMSASTEQVNASFEEIARAAQGSAADTQNMAAATEEQLASIEEITTSAAALSNLAEQMHATIKKYNV